MICYSYLDRHFDLFSHFCSNIIDLKENLFRAGNNLTGELYNVAEWLGYDMTKVKVTTLEEWVAFTQEVCLRQEKRKTELVELICPSYQPLKFHLARGSYIVSLALRSCISTNNYQDCGFGLFEKKGEIYIKWDIDVTTTELHISAPRQSYLKKCYCKPGKCTSCVNCYKACRPCTKKCACQINCQNPHNNGGTCIKCRNSNDISLQAGTPSVEPPTADQPVSSLSVQQGNATNYHYDSDTEVESDNTDDESDSNDEAVSGFDTYFQNQD